MIRSLSFFIGILMFWASAAPELVHAQPSRHGANSGNFALLFGSEYFGGNPRQFEDNRGAEEDAKALHSALVTAWGINTQDKNDADRLQLVTSSRSGKRALSGTDISVAVNQMKTRLVEYARQGNKPRLLFVYLNTHGVQALEDNTPYFVFADCKRDKLADTGYKVAAFLQALRGMPCAGVVICINACRNIAPTQPLPGIAQSALNSSYRDLLEPQIAMSSAYRLVPAGRAAPILSVFSCSSGQYSFSLNSLDPNNPNTMRGAFGYALEQQLLKAAKDNETLTFFDLCENAAKSVQESLATRWANLSDTDREALESRDITAANFIQIPVIVNPLFGLPAEVAPGANQTSYKDAALYTAPIVLSSDNTPDSPSSTDLAAQLVEALKPGAVNWSAADIALNAGAPPGSANARGDTYLHCAIRAQDEVRVRKALQGKAPVNAVNSSGNTPLGMASYLGLKPIMALLIANGASLESMGQNDSGPLNSPLIMACVGGQIDAARWLLEKGAAINARGQGLQTALNSVVSLDGEREELVQFTRELIAKGADVNLANSDGQTALHLAVIHDHPKLVALLLEAHAAPNVRDTTGKTALDWADPATQSGIIRQLVNAGGGANPAAQQ